MNSATWGTASTARLGAGAPAGEDRRGRRLLLSTTRRWMGRAQGRCLGRRPWAGRSRRSTASSASPRAAISEARRGAGDDALLRPRYDRRRRHLRPLRPSSPSSSWGATTSSSSTAPSPASGSPVRSARAAILAAIEGAPGRFLTAEDRAATASTSPTRKSMAKRCWSPTREWSSTPATSRRTCLASMATPTRRCTATCRARPRPTASSSTAASAGTAEPPTPFPVTDIFDAVVADAGRGSGATRPSTRSGSSRAMTYRRLIGDPARGHRVAAAWSRVGIWAPLRAAAGVLLVLVLPGALWVLRRGAPGLCGRLEAAGRALGRSLGGRPRSSSGLALGPGLRRDLARARARSASVAIAIAGGVDRDRAGPMKARIVLPRFPCRLPVVAVSTAAAGGRLRRRRRGDLAVDALPGDFTALALTMRVVGLS